MAFGGAAGASGRAAAVGRAQTRAGTCGRYKPPFFFGLRKLPTNKRLRRPTPCGTGGGPPGSRAFDGWFLRGCCQPWQPHGWAGAPGARSIRTANVCHDVCALCSAVSCLPLMRCWPRATIATSLAEHFPLALDPACFTCCCMLFIVLFLLQFFPTPATTAAPSLQGARWLGHDP